MGLGLVGGAALMTARHALMTPQPLKSGLPGEGGVDRLHGGDVYYSVAGPADGRALVLLHDFYPGASNYEFRAVYGRLAETYRVYAPDWLGFGMSERPSLMLTGEFYAGMLVGFLRDVVGKPAVVVARGRAANIAARAAADAPALFDRLALVGPDLSAGERLDPTAGQIVARLFQRVAMGLTPYAALSMRPALRLAEGRRSAVGSAQVDDDTLDHLYASAHQFGGQYGALAMLTGELDLPLQQVFPSLTPPALLVIGERDQRLPVARIERLVALNPHADLEVILSAGAAVYQDQPKLFIGALHRWMGRRIARQPTHASAQTVAAAEAEQVVPLPEAPARAVVTFEPEPSPVAPPVVEPPSVKPEPLPREEPSAEAEPAAAPPPPEAVVLPVKIVPVLDPAHEQRGNPQMRMRAAPQRGRKTAPRPAPRAQALPPLPHHKRGGSGRTPPGWPSPRSK